LTVSGSKILPIFSAEGTWQVAPLNTTLREIEFARPNVKIFLLEVQLFFPHFWMTLMVWYVV